MDQEKTRKVETPLSIATVEKGDRSGIRGPLQTVIRNQAEWNAFWKRHSSTDTNPPPAPIIDFNREMVVGIFLGEKSTGGYEVEIVRAERRDSSLYFYYREKSPQ
ncbi:MAG TPA: protease complex subunit PrcB family protein, partial [Candidatus Binatia bacterium]|nr:protease complex subunit PrcB family protein [Candidatus Binatia bacterium]